VNKDEYKALLSMPPALVHIATWWSGSGGSEAYLRGQTGFLQWFDAVSWVTWPVKIVPEMT